MRNARAALLLAVVGLSLAPLSAHTETVAPTEQQLKAVFVFNFTHFVTWPPGSFSTPTEPFVIGVLGADTFTAQLQEAVHNEHLDTHPLEVRQFRTIDDISDCKILYIESSWNGSLDQVLAGIAHTGMLTVSDLDGAARRGVTIELARQDNRIRLVINTDSAHSAGLTINSNLLRLARVAHTGD